jgi:hypothetical protein
VWGWCGQIIQAQELKAMKDNWMQRLLTIVVITVVTLWTCIALSGPIPQLLYPRFSCSLPFVLVFKDWSWNFAVH